MRVSKNISVVLPESLKKDLDKYLVLNPPPFKSNKEQFYYLLNHIVSKQIRNPKKEFLSLDEKKMKSVIGSNYSRYLKILIKGEFIISDRESIPGVKSYWYRLNMDNENDSLTEVVIDPTSNLYKRIVKRSRLERTHNSRLEPFLRRMNDRFMKVDLDYKKAKKWAYSQSESPIQELSLITSINQLEDKRFRYFKRNKTNGRLDTNFTNLKSELRYSLTEKFVSIDLKNSQPFLLGTLLNQLLVNNNSTLCSYLSMSYIIKTFGVKAIRDISKIRQNAKKPKMAKLSLYLESVKDGVFYDEFIDLYQGDIDRKEVKEIMFKVLFSKNEILMGYGKFVPYENEKEIFAEVYPIVYYCAKILKDKDNSILPIYLQRLESYIFIDCIAKRLCENGIVPLTIHDSVLVEPENVNKALKIMEEVFLAEIGVKPSFDVKPLFQEFKVCPVTGISLNHEKDGAKYIKTSTLKYLHDQDPTIFIELCSVLLSQYNGNRPKYENNIITHLAKQVRNRHYSKLLYHQNGYKQRKYPNQIEFNI